MESQESENAIQKVEPSAESDTEREPMISPTQQNEGKKAHIIPNNSNGVS